MIELVLLAAAAIGAALSASKKGGSTTAGGTVGPSTYSRPGSEVMPGTVGPSTYTSGSAAQMPGTVGPSTYVNPNVALPPGTVGPSTASGGVSYNVPFDPNGGITYSNPGLTVVGGGPGGNVGGGGGVDIGPAIVIPKPEVSPFWPSGPTGWSGGNPGNTGGGTDPQVYYGDPGTVGPSVYTIGGNVPLVENPEITGPTSYNRPGWAEIPMTPEGPIYVMPMKGRIWE